jgi:hypothetical protein
LSDGRAAILGRYVTRGCELLGGRPIDVRRRVAILFHEGRLASPVLTRSFTSSHIPSFADDLTAPRRNTRLPGVGRRMGGDMLFRVGLVLLAMWLLGLVGVYRIGDLFHVFLLVGLMLLLLGFVRARDAAVRAALSETKKTT